MGAIEYDHSKFQGVVSLDDMLEKEIHNNGTIWSLSSKPPVDLDGEINRFSSSKNSLDIKMLMKAIELGGENSLIYLKNSIVVPDVEASSAKVTAYKEYEFQTQEHKKGYLVPVTPCIQFEGPGLGSVSFNYGLKLNTGFSFNNNGNEGPTLTISVGASVGFSVSASASLDGTFSCNGKQGNDARLFATMSLLDIKGKVKDHMFKKDDNSLKTSSWKQISPFQYLTYLTPSFYCGSSDKMDLMCSAPQDELEKGKLPKYSISEVGKSVAFVNPT